MHLKELYCVVWLNEEVLTHIIALQNWIVLYADDATRMSVRLVDCTVRWNAVELHLDSLVNLFRIYVDI